MRAHMVQHRSHRLSLGLCLSLVVGTLAGCMGSSSSDNATTPTVEPYSTLLGPPAITGNFAYAVNTFLDSVSAYTTNNGVLTALPGSAAGDHPGSIIVDPSEQFVYVANSGSDNISAYRIGTNGTLSALPGSPFAAGNQPAVIIAVPTRALVYVANFSSNNVSAYTIQANGALTAVPGSPFAAGKGPEGITVDPTGKFAYVANGKSNNVSAYTIDANGTLTEVGPRVKAGDDPEGITVDPTGKFVYALNRHSKDVSVYRIGSNGALTEVSGSPFSL